MKARLTALLSLLLMMSAAFGVPVTSCAGFRVTAPIVCELRERRTEPVAPPRLAPRAPAQVTPAISESPAAVLLAHALFQRPPPAA